MGRIDAATDIAPMTDEESRRDWPPEKMPREAMGKPALTLNPQVAVLALPPSVRPKP